MKVCKVIGAPMRRDDGTYAGYGEKINIADDQVDRFVAGGQVQVLESHDDQELAEAAAAKAAEGSSSAGPAA